MIDKEIEPQIGTITEGGWAYVGKDKSKNGWINLKESKADKIRATVRQLCIAHEIEMSAYYTGWTFNPETRAKLEKELDELLKTL